LPGLPGAHEHPPQPGRAAVAPTSEKGWPILGAHADRPAPELTGSVSDRPRTSAGGAPSLEVFARRSSGLVRDLSIGDAAWYGVLAAGAMFGLIWAFPTPQVTLPGLSLPLASLISIVLMPAIFALYAGLGSAMPRMGGDYLYQSRALHPALGFALVFAWEVFMWAAFVILSALAIGSLGLQPLLYNLGVRLHAPGLVSAGTWFGSVTGLFVLSLFAAAFGLAITALGMRVYRTLQRYVLVPAVVISNVLLIVLLARSHGSFLASFDSFHQAATGQAHYSDTVMAAAAKAGYKTPGFSLWHSFLFLSVTGTFWYVMYAAQGLLGETKQAGNFGRLFKAFCWGGAYLGIVAWVIPTFLFEHAVGRDFMHAYASAYSAGSITEGSGANIASFAMMMTSSPIVMVLLSLGFIFGGLYYVCSVFLNMSRVLAAMGMDRALPDWFARVNQRFHAPVNAALFMTGLCLALSVLYRYGHTNLKTVILFGGAFTGVGVVAVTGLAGVLFPWRAKHVHDVSPVARHRILGVPLITVAGAVAVLASGTVTVLNLVVPALGFTSSGGRILLLASIVVAAVWYVAYGAWLRGRRGIDRSLAFDEIPPE
jgi:amino acid transporter